VISPPDARVGLGVGLGLSLALHALIYVLITTFGTVPELDFEFEMPTEIEFGMTDAMEASEAFEAPSTPPPTEPAGGEPAEEGTGEAAVDAGVPDAGRPDLGPPDMGPPDLGPRVAEAEPEEPESAAEGEGDAPAALPAGAQIAIRIDMERVRTSALNREVRELMAAIPDWQMLLEGSGLDPLDDLDRLLITSPNLQRSRMILAGRHSHPDEGTEFIRAVVARFAAERGVEAAWSEQEGVPVAPWPNQDATERVIAIVGPRHFVIARPADLSTVLAIAVTRETDDEAVEAASGADALLSMGDAEAFSVEVEGARNFVRGRAEHVPERIRLAIREVDDTAQVRGRARYEDEEAATEAATFWSAERDRFARNLFVGGFVRGLTLEGDGRNVVIEHQLSLGQMRLVMGYMQGLMTRRRPAPSP